jgi:hypothetical protein
MNVEKVFRPTDTVLEYCVILSSFQSTLFTVQKEFVGKFSPASTYLKLWIVCILYILMCWVDFKMTEWMTRGRGDTDSWKKPEVQNLKTPYDEIFIYCTLHSVLVSCLVKLPAEQSKSPLCKRTLTNVWCTFIYAAEPYKTSVKSFKSRSGTTVRNTPNNI